MTLSSYNLSLLTCRCIHFIRWRKFTNEQSQYCTEYYWLNDDLSMLLSLLEYGCSLRIFYTSFFKIYNYNETSNCFN